MYTPLGRGGSLHIPHSDGYLKYTGSPPFLPPSSATAAGTGEAGRCTGFLCLLLPSFCLRARALSWKDLHFGNHTVSFQELPGLWGLLPFATWSPQDLNKMKYKILIYSAGVSSFQLHVLLSLPSCGCRECSEMWPQPRAFPGLLGSAVEGRGRRSNRGTDRRTDRSCHLFFVCFILFFIYRFLQKNKSKKFFSIMSL